MKESILFWGALKNGMRNTGVYVGIHFWGLDWLLMLQFDPEQFALFRAQILDRGLFAIHGQIIIIEINLLGVIFSWRYTIPDYVSDEQE